MTLYHEIIKLVVGIDLIWFDNHPFVCLICTPNLINFVVLFAILRLIYLSMLFLLRANLLLMIHLLLGFGKIVRLVLRFRLIFEDRINGFVVCFRIVFFLDLVCFGRLGLFVFLVLKFLFLSEFDNLN